MPDTVRPVPRAFDTTPWTAKLSHRELRAFIRAEKAAGRASQASGVPRTLWFIVAAFWVFVAWGAWGIWTQISEISGTFEVVLGYVWVPWAIGGWLVFTGGMCFVVYSLVATNLTRWRTYYRAAHFATANHLRYTAEDESITARSTVLGLGLDKAVDANAKRPRIRDSYVAADGFGLEIGDYQYTTVIDGKYATPSWGYLRVRLPKSYPHIVFQERRGESVPWPQTGWQDLPTPQLLAPELTDFYTLHCPVEYQEDARAIFTAELILALKGRPKGRDTYIEGEILDDQLWIYQYGLPFNLYRAKNIRPAFDILSIALKARDAAAAAR